MILFIIKFSFQLLKRSIVHDLSKFSKYESEGFGELIDKLAGSTYGTDSYNNLLKQLQPILDHHYKHNSHHPEHYENGIDGMDLLDLVEMYLDWKASIKKHKDGDLNKSIEYNKTRFKISDNLVNIFTNSNKNKI